MSFVKFPMVLVDVVLPDTSFPTYFRVYLFLASHCDYASGVLHPVSASDVASAVGVTSRTVYRSVSKLRDLGWLVGGSGLSGQLVGFKSRPFRSASDVKALVQAAINEVAPNSPSRNGSHLKSAPERRETQTFEGVLSRARGNIPSR